MEFEQFSLSRKLIINNPSSSKLPKYSKQRFPNTSQQFESSSTSKVKNSNFFEMYLLKMSKSREKLVNSPSQGKWYKIVLI